MTLTTRSLYIHWPFCPYKCHFCPFVAYAGHDSFMDRYHAALMKEINEYAAMMPANQRIDTIFFGGGTPSTYPNHLLLDTSAILKKLFAIEDGAEITIEVNPGTVKPGQLEVWKRCGINRLSIGVQSLNDTVLHNLNRHQSAADVIKLITEAKEIIPNISIDLIIGLPGISPDEWKQLVQTVSAWPIMHISIYFLTIHEGTALYFRVKKNDVTLPVDEVTVDLYIWTVEYLRAMGFEQYEISNFGRSGFRARHNAVYWARDPYKGFGVGACSFDGHSRYQNNKNLFAYLSGMENGTSIVDFVELLTQEQVCLETIMLGLRQAHGLAMETIFETANETERVRLHGVIEEMERAGYVTRQDERLKLTPLGLAVENEIVVAVSNS
jgi:oxygen-independent coproporphyrinogen-3 oxidase